MRLEKTYEYIDNIKRLYLTAFPEEERNDFEYLLNGRFNNYELFSIIEQDVFVGFIFVTLFEDIAYVVYLAIEDEFRNCGFGSKALDYLKQKFESYNILLSIEKPVSEIQKRRLKFYEKNLFVNTGFELISSNVEFQVLCYGRYNKEKLLRFFKLNYPNAKYI